MKVNIKGNEIELKYTMRSMILFENITDKTFNPEGVTDILTYFYCVVLASSKDYTLTFDEFIDFIDDNPNIMKEFSEWLMVSVNQNNILKKN